MDGIRETSETIASECDVTFELYRNLAADTTRLACCYFIPILPFYIV